jgi:hypothetical protein
MHDDDDDDDEWCGGAPRPFNMQQWQGAPVCFAKQHQVTFQLQHVQGQEPMAPMALSVT